MQRTNQWLDNQALLEVERQPLRTPPCGHFLCWVARNVSIVESMGWGRLVADAGGVSEVVSVVQNNTLSTLDVC